MEGCISECCLCECILSEGDGCWMECGLIQCGLVRDVLYKCRGWGLSESNLSYGRVDVDT